MSGGATLFATPPQKIKDAFFAGATEENLSYAELFAQRTDIQLLANYSFNKIAKTNPNIFAFLNDKQAFDLEVEIVIALNHLIAQFKIDKIEQRKKEQLKRLEEIETCINLQNTLRQSRYPQRQLYTTQIDIAVQNSTQPVRYLALKEYAQFIVKKIEEFSNAKTSLTKQWMSEVNGVRLYWVWGGNLLATLIELLPKDFYRKAQAARAVAMPSRIAGYMSWILYYLRFGIELGLLLKHTVSGSWMDAEEKSLGTWKRFKSQWQHRKFALLNDSIWATLNLLCFFWLTGPGRLGQLGNVFTGSLLFMDLSLCIWNYFEKETEFRERRNKYQKEIDQLEQLLSEKEHEDTRRKLNQLKKLKLDYEFEWTYQRYSLINAIAYSAALLSAFSLMCCFYMPEMAGNIALHLSVVGAVLCFVFTVAYSAVELEIELKKTKATKQNIVCEFETIIKKFKDHQNKMDDNARKLLYMDLCQLAVDNEQQEKIIHYQKLNFIRSVLVDALIPVLIFSSFMFLPFGVGFAALGLGFAIMIFSKVILNQYDPSQKALPFPKFDEEKYNKILMLPNPTLNDFTAAKKKTPTHTFIDKRENPIYIEDYESGPELVPVN